MVDSAGSSENRTDCAVPVNIFTPQLLLRNTKFGLEFRNFSHCLKCLNAEDPAVLSYGGGLNINCDTAGINEGLNPLLTELSCFCFKSHKSKSLHHGRL